MFIHVTHDQEEALSVADRIVVMHEGRIEQVASPYTISTQPENEQVASFMGDNNIFRGTVVSHEGDRLVIDSEHAQIAVLAPGDARAAGAEAAVAIRAAAMHVDENGSVAGEPNQLECEIRFVEYLGDLVKLHLAANGKPLVAKVTGDRYPELQGREGSTVRISWREDDAQLLGA
jgi:ABC-type Fe3+/spermidine/putrescine transport system ATPase subunit